MSRQHIGIIATIVGTVLLAFSIQTRRQYQGEIGKVVDREKHANPNLLEPTETRIVRWRFWAGLFFVALGSGLQW
jgi:hypothetical protein